MDLVAPGENIYSTMPISQTATLATSVSVGGISYAALPLEDPHHSCPWPHRNDSSLRPRYPEDFPAAVSGNIALIQRGEVTFSGRSPMQKTPERLPRSSMITPQIHSPSLVGHWALPVPIPALQVTRATGQSILTQLPASSTVLHGKNLALAYQFLDGTSMACPHVAGAVAFAALNFPAESLSQRIDRINNNVTLVLRWPGK